MGPKWKMVWKIALTAFPILLTASEKYVTENWWEGASIFAPIATGVSILTLGVLYIRAANRNIDREDVKQVVEFRNNFHKSLRHCCSKYIKNVPYLGIRMRIYRCCYNEYQLLDYYIRTFRPGKRKVIKCVEQYCDGIKTHEHQHYIKETKKSKTANNNSSYPKGLVGLSYTTGEICLDLDLKKNNNISNKYNMSGRRTTRCEFAITIPVYDKNSRITHIVSYDGYEKFVIPDSELENIKATIIEETDSNVKDLRDKFPHLFK